MLDDAVRSGIPGVSVRVDDGDEPYTIAGHADWADPLSPDADFRVGSNSKTATAVVILQLVDAGELELEDTLDTWFADLPHGDTATVRMLLNHTAGLADYALQPSILPVVAGQSSSLPDEAELIQIGVDATLAAEPLTGYHYSNTGYALLGVIAQRVSGQSVETLFNNNVALPLGLTETRFASQGEESAIHGYEPDAEGLAPILPAGTPDGFSLAGPTASTGWVDVTAIDQSWDSAAGSMISTAAEWATFQRALLAGELITPESMNEMQTTVSEGEAAVAPGRTYGLGVEKIVTACGTMWGHDGALPGYRSDSYTDELGQRSMTVFSTTNFGIIAQPAAQQAHQKLIEAAACAMFREDLPR